MPIKLYLVQHGEALPKEDDPARPLSEKGQADVRRLAAFTVPVVQMTAIPQFPAVWRDISIVVPAAVTVAEIVRDIQAAAQGRVHDVELFDVYRGQGILEGHRSLAFRLEYRHQDRTLTDQDVLKVHSRIVKRLEKKGIRLRE